MNMIMIWRHVHVLLISQYWLVRVNIHSKCLESLDHRAPWLRFWVLLKYSRLKMYQNKWELSFDCRPKTCILWISIYSCWSCILIINLRVGQNLIVTLFVSEYHHSTHRKRPVWSSWLGGRVVAVGVQSWSCFNGD